MDALRLLLVPSFTELEWGIRPQLEEWAEIASFDIRRRFRVASD
jgi:hypothetical protein